MPKEEEKKEGHIRGSKQQDMQAQFSIVLAAHARGDEKLFC